MISMKIERDIDGKYTVKQYNRLVDIWNDLYEKAKNAKSYFEMVPLQSIYEKYDFPFKNDFELYNLLYRKY